MIVDEMSMVDVALFPRCCGRCVPARALCWWGMPTSSLRGRGERVLRTHPQPKKSKRVFLREVFRQAEQSAIIRNAHRVNLGQSPELTGNQGDFFFLCRRDAQRAVSTVLELCRTRLPDNMHIPAEQIQVLTHPKGPLRHRQSEPAFAGRPEIQRPPANGSLLGRAGVPGGGPHHADPERLRCDVGRRMTEPSARDCSTATWGRIADIDAGASGWRWILTDGRPLQRGNAQRN